MSWQRTNQWWSTLREVATEVERARDGRLPWHPRYAEVFGDRDGLLAALRYRWRLMVQAHSEEFDSPDGAARYQELVGANTGLCLLLCARPAKTERHPRVDAALAASGTAPAISRPPGA